MILLHSGLTHNALGHALSTTNKNGKKHYQATKHNTLSLGYVQHEFNINDTEPWLLKKLQWWCYSKDG